MVRYIDPGYLWFVLRSEVFLAASYGKEIRKNESDVVPLVKITKNTPRGKYNLPIGAKMKEKLQRLYLVRNLKTAPPYLEISIIIHDFCDV